MNYQVRHMPTPEGLRRVKQLGFSESDVNAVDLMLNLIATSDMMRSIVFEPLAQAHDISEGKFTLLMAIYGEGDCTLSELALRIGVSVPTVSVMVRRMLASESPLIEVITDPVDARTRRASLTEEGRKLIEALLPPHFTIIRGLSDRLDAEEQAQLTVLLRKLRQG